MPAIGNVAVYPVQFFAVALALGAIIFPGSQVFSQSIRSPAPMERGSPFDLTMVEAIALGMRSNWTVRTVYVQRIAERYDLWLAKQRFVPRAGVTGAAEIGRAQGQSNESATVGTNVTWLAPTGAVVDFSWNRLRGSPGYSTAHSVSFSQPLLQGAGVAINMAPIRLARLQEDINRLNARRTVSNIITSIILAYRNLIQARDQVSLAEGSLKRSRDQLQVNRNLVEAGRMAAADLVQNEADIANQELGLLQVQRSADTARIALLRLLALDLHTRLGTLDTLRPEAVSIDPDRLIEISKANRADLLVQQKSVEQAQLNLALARNDRLWDLSAYGSYSGSSVHSKDGGERLRTNASFAGLRLTVPLLDPGRAQGEVSATTALRTSELQFEDSKQQVEAEVRDLTAQVESNWLQFKAANHAYDLSQLALSLARKKLQVGRAANFEVLTYEANLRSAEAQKLTASVAYLNSLTVLDETLGTTTDTWRIELNY